MDASLRMGLELNLQQQSALAMLLEGSSYKDVAQSLNISHGHAIQITQDALKALPGMTDDMLRTIRKCIELSKI